MVFHLSFPAQRGLQEVKILTSAVRHEPFMLC